MRYAVNTTQCRWEWVAILNTRGLSEQDIIMTESARLSAPGSQNSSTLLSVRDNEVPSNVVGQELVGKKVAMKDIFLCLSPQYYALTISVSIISFSHLRLSQPACSYIVSTHFPTYVCHSLLAFISSLLIFSLTFVTA